MKKIVIVGGVAGGIISATRLRRLSENIEIVMFERGGYVSFANCGLPYHLSGVIPERKKLLLQSPESFKSRYNVDVRVDTEIIKINRQKKRIEAKNLITGEVYEESYDILLLSPGAEPNVPAIAGLREAGYHFMRSIEDLDGAMATLANNASHKGNALVIGGGYIGLEVAENLVEAGITTHLIEHGKQVMAAVDIEIAVRIHEELLKKEVLLHLETGIEKIVTTNGASKVYLKNKKILDVDAIFVATGVRPRTRLASDAGLSIGKKGGILVNEYFQTDDPDIFAVGDAIEIKHLVHGKPAIIPLAWLANRQGRLVADNILGIRKRAFKGGLGTSIVKIFDLTVAATGLNERFLKENRIPYEVATINRLDHAGYYPEAQDMILKLLFNREGNILGAQAIGPKSVDKRIDIIASAMIANMTVYDLQEIEVAYAPPYNSAKDPVNIVGYLAENMLTGMVEQVEYHQLDELLQQRNHVLLDVRTPAEFEEGTIPGAENIELDVLRDNLNHLDKNKTYIVFCRVGFRSYNACRILVNHGYKAVNLNGGFTLWQPIARRLHYTNYIGIQIENHQFEMALASDHKIVATQRYPNNHAGCELMLKDLENLNCQCEDTLFYIRSAHHRTPLYQCLSKRGSNIWLHDNQINGTFPQNIAAANLAIYAMKHTTKAKIFEPPKEVKRQLQLLAASKQKLITVKSNLIMPLKGEHNTDDNGYGQDSLQEFYWDTLNALDQDLHNIDSKIDTLWSLSLSMVNH